MAGDDRRRELLAAARRAFSSSGDIGGTTVKAIALEAKVSESIIYRHFDSKEELFFEAIVEPLQETMRESLRRFIDLTHAPLRSDEERVEILTPLVEGLMTDLTEVLPLLGLVLFGDPARARRFYKSTIEKSLDKLASAWTEYFQSEFDIEFPGRLVAQSVLGLAIIAATESRLNPRSFDSHTVAHMLAEMLLYGFFPHRENGEVVFRRST